MANSPQALKRARQAEKRRRRNQSVSTKFRTMLKRAGTAVAAGNETAADFTNMQSATDIAARKGLIHPRKAARLKKRLNSKIRNHKAHADSSTDNSSKAETGSQNTAETGSKTEAGKAGATS